MNGVSPRHLAGIGMALDEARLAATAGEVPVGAVIVDSQGRVLGRAHNRMVEVGDPTAHAEVLAIREAVAMNGGGRLEDSTMYVSLEPCAQCAGAIVLARIATVVFAAWDDKAGMAGSLHDLLRHPRLNHRATVIGGVLAEESAELLQSFFRARRGPGS